MESDDTSQETSINVEEGRRLTKPKGKKKASSTQSSSRRRRNKARGKRRAKNDDRKEKKKKKNDGPRFDIRRRLPSEVQVLILGFLPLSDLFSTRATCREWRSISEYLNPKLTAMCKFANLQLILHGMTSIFCCGGSVSLRKDDIEKETSAGISPLSSSPRFLFFVLSSFFPFFLFSSFFLFVLPLSQKQVVITTSRFRSSSILPPPRRKTTAWCSLYLPLLIWQEAGKASSNPIL